LTCTCSLITLGALADVLGAKNIFLLGCALLCAFNIACSRAQSAAQVIAFRACLGFGTAMCMPTAISIIARLVSDSADADHLDDDDPVARRRKSLRSFGLALQGLGLPLGFALGLLLGGFFADSHLTWRFAFYLNAGLNAVIIVHGVFVLPADVGASEPSPKLLLSRTDLVGALLSVLILAPLLVAFA